MRDESRELLANGRKFLDARSPNGVCHANVNKKTIVKSKLLWRLIVGACAAGTLWMHCLTHTFAQPAPPITPNPAPPVTPNPAPPITPNPVPPIVPNPAVPIESPAPSPTITPLPLWLGVYCAVASQNFLSVLAWSFFPTYCLASRLNKNAPSTMNK